MPNPENNPKNIYPTPKTYDEIQADIENRQKLRDSRYSHHPKLLIFSWIALLIAGLILIIWLAPKLFWKTMPLAGVSGFFLLGIIWFFCALGTWRKIRHEIDNNPNFR